MLFSYSTMKPSEEIHGIVARRRQTSSRIPLASESGKEVSKEEESEISGRELAPLNSEYEGE